MELKSNEEKVTRAVLISVNTGEYDADTSLLELVELAKTAGAETVATVMQNLDRPETATYVGKGKLLEISEFCESQEIDLLIFDSELSPTQIRNIEEETGVRVIDRTMLILDIFAMRARSKEGKLQVELAQLKYMMPRLTGMGTAMSRLGGGIGTRGPGETKLETDRRHIRRRKDNVITVAIVGYTNAGKSTLMNYLTDAGVLAENKLFATLDPTSRALKLPNGVTVMLIDTVGLVRRLPHHLVDAFRSTLEEAAEADIILNVCDVSSEEASLHLKVTRELLESLGCKDTPIIPVLNKCDLVSGGVTVPQIGTGVRISAKEGKGIDELLHAIEDNLPVKVKRVKALLPFDKLGISAEIREKCILNSEEYVADGLLIDAVISEEMYSKIRDYIVE